MRALKALVVAMGVLLVLGIAALGFGIAYRIHHPGTPATGTIRVAVAPNSMPRAVALPPGSRVVSAQSEGDRVMVRLALADGGEELILIDWRSGATLGALTLK